MANLNVAVLGSPGYAKELGKKGTESDLTFYNLKRGEDSVTMIEPSRYPEKLSPLFYAISLAKKAILVVEKIDPAFGETVLMLDCIGRSDGLMVLRNFIALEQIAPLIKGTALEGYRVVEDDPIAIREALLEEATSMPPSDGANCGTMPVDHFFNVRGIGTVALGSVVQGTIKKHDVLSVLPGEKTAQIRSIQKHDQDFDWAGEGDRAGVALKGLDVDDLDRGTILTNDGTIQTISNISARARLVKYWPSPIKEGMVLHIGHWTQFLPARVQAVSVDGDWHEPTLSLSLEKPLVCRPTDRAVLTYPEGGKLRVAGTIEIPQKNE
ncbi:MAG: elongation factor Tu [Methanotrichaceae archaeon]|nr:elongation factor Tu [Methanotrichaceae archaeon]